VPDRHSQLQPVFHPPLAPRNHLIPCLIQLQLQLLITLVTSRELSQPLIHPLTTRGSANRVSKEVYLFHIRNFPAKAQFPTHLSRTKCLTWSLRANLVAESRKLVIASHDATYSHRRHSVWTCAHIDLNPQRCTYRATACLPTTPILTNTDYGAPPPQKRHVN
jgi:hypothetical protein